MTSRFREIPDPGHYSDENPEDCRTDRYDQWRSDARRLLGTNRTFRRFSVLEKAAFLHTGERIKAYDLIDTTTLPRAIKANEKRGIIADLMRRQILQEELLKNAPTVYLGSGCDIEYPLAIGSRHTIMVDPILATDGAVNEILRRIAEITGSGFLTFQSGILAFRFDFGAGPEPVDVHLNAARVPYGDGKLLEGNVRFRPPPQIGHLLLFAGQGPEGRIEVTQDMTSRVIPGGAIIKDYTVTRFSRTTGEPEILTLGTPLE